jgi:nitroreductase/NAD-dependent dihydropyrimidine dehydrogenase PreA subunit
MGKNGEAAVIGVNPATCIKCGACQDVCPDHIFSLSDMGVTTRYEEHCIACGHCIAVCPTDSIGHSGLDMDGFIPIDEKKVVSTDSIYQFLRSRRSCRAYTKKVPTREVLERLVDAARFAPTGHNYQDVSFTVITDAVMIKKLSGLVAEFFGGLAQMMEQNPGAFDEKLLGFQFGFKMSHEFYTQGKDRVFRGAPVVILTHTDKSENMAAHNCHNALFHIALIAEALGLGTCINGYFPGAVPHVPEIGEVLAFPEGHELFGCITVGYPARKFKKLPARNEAEVTWK